MDFLFHEMPVTTFVDHALASSDDYHFPIDRLTVRVKHLGAIGRHDGVVIVLEVNNIAGQMGQRNGVRTDEAGSLANPNRQRRSIPSNNHHIRLVNVHGRKGKCAFDLRKHMGACFPCIHSGVKTGKKQVCQHLRVGFAGEFMSLVFKLRSQLHMVFNDAVMDDRHFLIGNVRMGISFGNAPMSCPSRMSNPGASHKRRFTKCMR